MSEAVVVDIPSLIRRESLRERPDCLIQRYQLPEYYYPSYLRHQHPNEPLSSTLSDSSSISSSLNSYDEEEDENVSQENALHLQSISTDDEDEERGNNVNDSLSTVSVEGEFDTRIDIIRSSPKKKVKISTSTSPKLVAISIGAGVGAGVVVVASAPPLSDDENNNENNCHQQQQKEPQQQQEEPCVCVICYETFEEPIELILGRNYTSEELEDIEGKEKITNFCQTCKYNVHHRCFDEYRLNKMGEIIRNSYQRGRVHSPNITGTFGMRCLMCSKEVEKIHISENGEVRIEKMQQPSYAANTEQRQQQEQQQNEELMRNRMQRRLRRRQQLEFCRKKICSICFMFLVAITLLVLVFRAI